MERRWWIIRLKLGDPLFLAFYWVQFEAISSLLQSYAGLVGLVKQAWKPLNFGINLAQILTHFSGEKLFKKPLDLNDFFLLEIDLQLFQWLELNFFWTVVNCSKFELQISSTSSGPSKLEWLHPSRSFWLSGSKFSINAMEIRTIEFWLLD